MLICAQLLTQTLSQYYLQKTDSVTRSFILAISVCYCARLQNREEFEQELVKKLTSSSKHFYLPEGIKEFRNEIEW